MTKATLEQAIAALAGGRPVRIGGLTYLSIETADNATLAVLDPDGRAALIVGAPAIGGALFVADKLLGDRVARFASVQYDVKGPWQDPQISFDKPFEKPQ